MNKYFLVSTDRLVSILIVHVPGTVYFYTCFWKDKLEFWPRAKEVLADLGEGNGTPLQYSRLENPMDRGAWLAAVHGVAKSWTWLSDFTFIFNFHALEKEMATHSSVLAWRTPGTGEPGGLPSMGLHRVAHDWSNLAARKLRWEKDGGYLKLPLRAPHTTKRQLSIH